MNAMRNIVFLLLLLFTLSTCCLGQKEAVPKGKTIVDLAGGIIIGKASYLPKPPFPSCNCRFSKVNSVAVRFVVNEKGYVESAEAISGHLALKAVSVFAVRNSRFYPSSANGEPVKAYGVITYEFKITTWRTKVRILSYNLKLQKDE